LEHLDVVRLKKQDENRIGDLAEQSAELRGRADLLEQNLCAEAEGIIDRFIGNGMKPML